MPYYDENFFLKTFERLGVGVSDISSLKLSKTNPAGVKKLLSKLAEFDKWKIERDEESKGLYVLEWTAGDFSLRGYQKITITLSQIGEDVEVRVASKSKGGQITDWGANKYNVERIQGYLHNPDQELSVRKVPIESRGIVALVIISILVLLFLFFSFSGGL